VSISSEFADWLQSDGARIVTSNAGAAAWGDLAVDSSIRSPFDEATAANDEGARQIAFFGAPRIIEKIWVPGQMAGIYATCQTITADAEGYRGGAAVFVIGVDEQDQGGGSVLTVVRRLS
jgi:hypothetical protein